MIKEYKCEGCGHIVEVWERFDKLPDRCPICGGDLKKIVSKTTFHLKGSGWYVTDYCKQKPKGKGE
jgi:putative FmdB family regulatory protein